jgi:hypothetical protein
MILATLLPAQGVAEFQTVAQRAGEGVTWFKADPRLLEEGRNRQEVQQSEKASKDFDRNAAMDEALAEAKSKGKFLFWYIPRILKSSFPSQGAQMYRPAILDGYVKATFFTDPDLVDLLNRQFVPVRLIVDAELGKRFDIEAPNVVEPAFVILDGEGKVVQRIDRIRTFNSAWFYRTLSTTLATRPEMHKPTPVAQPATITQVATSLRRDGLEVSDRILSSTIPPQERAQALLERVRYLRLNGQLEAATQLLSTISDQVGSITDRDQRRSFAAEVSCETGRVQLQNGNLETATKAFKEVRSGPKAEAAFHLGMCAYFQGNDSFAARHWKESVLSDPQSPWAVKSAVNLVDGTDRTPIGPTIHGFEDPFQTDSPVANATNTGFPRTPKDAQAIAKNSLEYLLRMQRENGGWTDSRYAYWPTPDITPNVWIAATALSCCALLDWRELNPEAVEVALARGEHYMFSEQYIARGFQEEIYSEAYKLFYLTRKFDSTKLTETRSSCIEKMNLVIMRCNGAT